MKRIGETRTRRILGLILLSLVLGSVGAGAFGQQWGPPQEPPAGIITPHVLFFFIIEELEASIQMDRSAYMLGETGVIQFGINQPAYIYVWTVCPTARRIAQLFPSANDPDNRFSAGNHTIPTAGRQYRLQAGPPEGWKWMQIMALSAPLPGVGPHAHIPFPPLDLSPADWSQQFLSWLDQQLPDGASRAFNFTNYQIVGTPVVQQGTLRVTSDPAGAEVIVNGIPKAVTSQWQPVEIPLAPGSYSLVVRLAGHQDYSTTVQVTAGGVHNVHADLVGVVGQGNLRIISQPAGLRVYIGGDYRGNTPLDVALPAGIHPVHLTSAGVVVWQSNVIVLPFLTQTITVTVGEPSACNYVVSPTSHTFPHAGGTVSVGVNAPVGCTWIAASPCGWVTVTPASGSGSRTIVLTAEPFLGVGQRICSVIVAGREVLVSQGADVSLHTVSTPSIDGPTTGNAGQSLVFTASGATCSLGHPVQYQFEWDGTPTGWTSATTWNRMWSTAGTYQVRVRARCREDTTVVSAWSPALTVSIVVTPPAHTVSTPSIDGPTTGTVGESLRFTVGRAACSQGHDVHYQFDWGVPLMGWEPYTTPRSNTWHTAGTYQVRVRARCSRVTSVVSAWSPPLTVNITAPVSRVRITLTRVQLIQGSSLFGADEVYILGTITQTGRADLTMDLPGGSPPAGHQHNWWSLRPGHSVGLDRVIFNRGDMHQVTTLRIFLRAFNSVFMQVTAGDRPIRSDHFLGMGILTLQRAQDFGGRGARTVVMDLNLADGPNHARGHVRVWLRIEVS